MLTQITANEADMDDRLVAGVITVDSTKKKNVELIDSFGHRHFTYRTTTKKEP